MKCAFVCVFVCVCGERERERALEERYLWAHAIVLTRALPFGNVPWTRTGDWKGEMLAKPAAPLEEHLYMRHPQRDFQNAYHTQRESINMDVYIRKTVL